MLFALIIVITVLALVFFLSIQKNQLPGPKGFPFIGPLFSLIKNQSTLHLLLENWSDKYGPIYEVNVLGRRLVSELNISKEKKIKEFTLHRLSWLTMISHNKY